MTNRTVKVDIKADISDYNRKMLLAAAATKTLAGSLDSSRNQMAGLVQAGLAVGPALVGVGAAATPAIAGLTNQFAFATAAAGVSIVAFQGVGDALTALNNYALDPTDAHLQKLAQTMEQLGPAGQQFVQFLQDLRPQVQELQNIAQAGLFPGIEAGITSLMQRGPEISNLFAVISKTTGDLIAEAGDNLADPRWNDFFEFLLREAKPTLEAMGRTIGNFTEGLAELWMAFEPLTTDFSQGFLDMSRDFAQWADQLSQTQGFQDFLAYVERVGPKAGDALGALGNAFVQLVEAAAPVGELALPMLEALFDTLAAFLNTPFGPALIALAAGLAAVSTAIRISNFAQGRALFRFLRDITTLNTGAAATSAWIGTARGIEATGQAAGQASQPLVALGEATGKLGERLRTTAKAAGVGGGLAFAMSDLDDKMGLANTTTLALAGSIGGVWGAAIGAGIGLALDYAAANDDVGDALKRADAAANDTSQSIQSRIAAVNAEIAVIKRRRAELIANQGAAGAFAGAADTAEEDAALKRLGVTKRDLTNAAQEQAFAEAGLSGAMEGTSQATRDQTYALLENIRVKNAAADAALTAFGAETSYRQALKDAREQADSNNAGIDGMSAAALKNRADLEALAGAWNRLADAGQATTGDMRKAKADFIAVAIAMGVGAKRAREMADEMFHIPEETKPRVVVIDDATSTIRKIGYGLGKLKDKIIYVTTIHRTYYRTPGNKAPGNLSGGKGKRGYTGLRIPPGFAEGGLLGGIPPSDPTADNMVAFSADTGRQIFVRSGEWIINERQSRNNDAWLRAINSGLNLGPYPQLAPHFADGGMVGGSDGASVWDERGLERAFSRALSGARFQLDKDSQTLQLTTRRGR